MNNIIVPIDFSKHSEYALEPAAVLAKNHNANILALHMLEISEALLTKTDKCHVFKNIKFLTLFLIIKANLFYIF
jgi:hypothetical protein